MPTLHEDLSLVMPAMILPIAPGRRWLYEDLSLVLPVIGLLFPVYCLFLLLAANGAAAPKWRSCLTGVSALGGIWLSSAALAAVIGSHGRCGPAVVILGVAFGTAVSYEIALRYKGLAVLVGWVFLVTHLLLITWVVHQGARAFGWL